MRPFLLGFVALPLVIALGSCAPAEEPAPTPTEQDIAAEKLAPFTVWTDQETGCEYLYASRFYSGMVLTPRTERIRGGYYHKGCRP